MSHRKANFCLFAFMWLALYSSAFGETSSTMWQGSYPDGFSAKITLSNSKMTIADTLTVAIDLEYPKDYKPQLDFLRKALLVNYEMADPPFTLANQNIGEPINLSNDSFKQHVRYALSPQIAGTHHIAMRTIQFLSADSKKESFKQLLMPIFTVNVDAPSQKFAPYEMIAPLMPMTQKLPVTISSENRRTYTRNEALAEAESQNDANFIKKKQFPWLGILLAIVFVIVWLLVKYSPSPAYKESTEKIKAPELPPGQAALQALDNMPQEGKSPYYFHHIDGIVRTFVKDKYHVDLNSRTTPEMIVQEQIMTNLPEKLRVPLITFFEENDQRKFTGSKHVADDYQQAEQQARGLIETWQ